jgi:ferredoxin/flavodoxin
MNAEIYYFSGTGNSLAAARDISGKLNGKLTSIPSVIGRDSIETDADVVGIVFPVYHGGLPNIVRKFAGLLKNMENKYIFAISTYGDGPGIAVKLIGKIINEKGGILAAGFSVQLPYNYIIPSYKAEKKSFQIILRQVSFEKQKGLIEAWLEKLDSIAEYVKALKSGIFETKMELLIKLIELFKVEDRWGKKLWLKMAGYSGPAAPTFHESIKLMDHGFHTDEKCTGCGICARVCPVSDIKMTENRPSWLHNCEQCFACLQWCPEKAISFGKDWESQKDKTYRYHHPDVKLSEMLKK